MSLEQSVITLEGYDTEYKYSITVNVETNNETSFNDKPSYIRYHKNGNIACERWKIEGKYYQRSSEYPNEINYYENGNIESERWKDQNGNIHRVDKPAFIEYDKNTGKIILENYMNHGNLHNYNGNPSVVAYCIYPYHYVSHKSWNTKEVSPENINNVKREHYNYLGNVVEREYHVENTLDLPMHIFWDYAGKNVVEKIWKKKINSRTKVLHRIDENLPARILYVDGKPFLEEYYKEDELIKVVTF